MMNKSSSPECQKCGYNGSLLIGAGERGGIPWAKFRCTFCRNEFIVGTTPISEGECDSVIYHRIKCPVCKSKRVSVASTRGKLRHHKCQNCGKAFRSIEQ